MAHSLSSLLSLGPMYHLKSTGGHNENCKVWLLDLGMYRGLGLDRSDIFSSEVLLHLVGSVFGCIDAWHREFYLVQ